MFVYIKNNRRLDSLDPLYHGPYEIVRVIRPNVQIRDHRRGLRVVHINNCPLQKPTEIILLPPAEELVTVPGEHNELSKGGEFQPPLKEEVIAPEDIVQTDLQTDELYSDNNLLNNRADACNDVDIPIALRNGRRHKPKNFGDDFETNFN